MLSDTNKRTPEHNYNLSKGKHTLKTSTGRELIIGLNDSMLDTGLTI
jgi:hypothetical protein